MLQRENVLECVYLDAWETGSQAKAGVGRWITFYNHQRPMPLMEDNRPPWSTSTTSKPTSRRRE